MGAPGGPRPPEAPDQGQSRKRRHHGHSPVWLIQAGSGGGGAGVGPLWAGQVPGRFWAGGAEVAQIPDRLRAGGLRGSSAPVAAVAAAVAAVAEGRGEEELSRTPGGPSRSLFLPEEPSFLGRTLTPAVSRGSPCGHLSTQWRCLSLPPIPSIRTSVGASAARCPPPAGREPALPARGGRSGPPGLGESCPFPEALFCKSLEEVGGSVHPLGKKGDCESLGNGP